MELFRSFFRVGELDEVRDDLLLDRGLLLSLSFSSDDDVDEDRRLFFLLDFDLDLDLCADVGAIVVVNIQE